MRQDIRTSGSPGYYALLPGLHDEHDVKRAPLKLGAPAVAVVNEDAARAPAPVHLIDHSVNAAQGNVRAAKIYKPGRAKRRVPA